MSRLEDVFRKSSKKALLMPYITGGYPGMDGCRRVLRSFIDAGADIIELGVPFSDPLADGPVVQASTQQALADGITTDDVLALAGEFTNQLPVVLLVYYNCIYTYGQDRFLEAAAVHGLSGLVVPDLPVDEAGDFVAACHVHGIDPIMLVAPTSLDERIAMIAENASGFIYCVSVAGVTGARASLGDNLPAFLERVRSRTNVPLAVGFGVSGTEQAAEVSKYADGVIIGSRLISMVDAADDLESACRNVEEFLNEVNEVLK
ncbi:tryptophan synthase alpha chain [bacterium BMS3Abin01]|nr:tryptophan synthase alpha chain [bacterium BMS3Abin01]HDZ59814.1 tryptophan synthase subunit alpha [Actinomycetota bacterium]